MSNPTLSRAVAESWRNDATRECHAAGYDAVREQVKASMRDQWAAMTEEDRHHRLRGLRALAEARRGTGRKPRPRYWK